MPATLLAEVEMDPGIQCRAAINAATVNEYAERMRAGDRFPPIDLFGERGRYWIDDDTHGTRRTNADKRRCIEIALAEFPDLSSRAIAEMCGVAHTFVTDMRVQVESNSTSTKTGAARRG